MKRFALFGLVLATAFALQGCAPENTEQAPVVPEETSSQDVQQVPDVESEDNSEAVSPESLFSVAHEDGYKSVFLLNQKQIEQVTGLTLTQETIEDVGHALEAAPVWQDDARSAEYASVITEAFSRESDSAARALHAVLDRSNARLKIFVLHNGHKELAHIETGGEG